jgi:hypothetical protein
MASKVSGQSMAQRRLRAARVGSALVGIVAIAGLVSGCGGESGSPVDAGPCYLIIEGPAKPGPYPCSYGQTCVPDPGVVSCVCDTDGLWNCVFKG